MTRYFIIFYWDGEPGRHFQKTFGGEYVSIARIEEALGKQKQCPIVVTNIIELSSTDYQSATTPR